jgi:hypothetical protein
MKHDCSPKLLLSITILRMSLRYKPNDSWHYGTISGKVTYLVEVEDEIQLTPGMFTPLCKAFYMMYFKLSCAWKALRA